MADKPRNTGRPAGPKAGSDRGARPGERPRSGGRPAGKPERGPAKPRQTVGGVDLDALERLEQEGLLNADGRRLRDSAGPADPGRRTRPGGGFRPAGGRTTRTPGAGRGPRPEGDVRQRGDERPARQGGGFGASFGGYESVDEQLARSVGRGGRFSPNRRPRPTVEEDDFFAEGPRPVRSADRRKGERPPQPQPRQQRGDRAKPEGPERGQRQPRPTTLSGRRGAPKPAPGPRKLSAAEAEIAERLHKVMARAGVASRRHSEELIQAGRVTVNGRVVTELGTKVVAGRDLVEIDGRPLGKPESFVYLLLYKPKGYVTTLYDPQGRPKVTDLLGDEIGARVYPVGRLDYDTEGLLLLTNDGELANALMHPAKQVKKTYIAKVRGVPGPAKLRALETGIELEDGVTAPADVKMIEVKAPNAATVSIRIHEGRNRQVRRMFEAVGHEVIHLKRTTLGPLHLKDLAAGQWRNLTSQEIKDLYMAAGLRYRAPGSDRSQ